MMQIIHCPRCGSENAHMINTWIVGNNSFSCNGEDVFPDTTIKKIIDLPTTRGSIITIMFESEQCDHIWVKIIHFHKGETYVEDEIIDPEILEQIGFKKWSVGMWRD